MDKQKITVSNTVDSVVIPIICIIVFYLCSLFQEILNKNGILIFLPTFVFLLFSVSKNIAYIFARKSSWSLRILGLTGLSLFLAWYFFIIISSRIYC